MSKAIGHDEIAAALEEQIRRARFLVQISDEDPEYAYVLDVAMNPPTEGVVLSGALPVATARERCDKLRARRYHYLWAKETTDVAYYGFGSAIVHRPRCGQYVLVMTPAEHAVWQHQRLCSGLQAVLGAHAPFETAADALVALAEGKALGVL